MRKAVLFLAAVFALGVLARAADTAPAPAQDDKKAARQEKIAEFKKQFQEKREQNIAVNKALYEQYQAAKTDKDKAAVEAKIKAQAAQEVNDGLALTDKALSTAGDNLKKAQDRKARAEKNRDKIIAKRVEDIKAGKYNQPAFGRDCDGGQCPMPLTGVFGGPDNPPPDNSKPSVPAAK